MKKVGVLLLLLCMGLFVGCAEKTEELPGADQGYSQPFEGAEEGAAAPAVEGETAEEGAAEAAPEEGAKPAEETKPAEEKPAEEKPAEEKPAE